MVSSETSLGALGDTSAFSCFGNGYLLIEKGLEVGLECSSWHRSLDRVLLCLEGPLELLVLTLPLRGPRTLSVALKGPKVTFAVRCSGRK